MNRPDEASSQPKQVFAREIGFQCIVRPRNAPHVVKNMLVHGRDREEVIQKLLSDGFMVVSIKGGGLQVTGLKALLSFWIESGKTKAGLLPMLQAISSREVIFFAVQLSTLLKAGIPLLRSLDIIQKGIANPSFKQVLQTIKKRVSGGGTLSGALREHANIFPWVWINMVEVGEATGKLPQCLEEIAKYQESAARIKSKIITAFMYPGILSCAVVGALTFLLVYIVPKFTAIFTEQKMELPILTKIVVAISSLLKDHFLVVAVLLVVGVAAFLYFRKLPKVSMFFDTLALGAPVFGQIVTEVSVVRFCRSLATLLRSEVPILHALQISGRLCENQFVEFNIKQVGDSVKGGQGLGIQLESKKLFPVFMTQLISVGEESGELERFLDMIANYYEDSVDTFLTRLTTMLEPFLLIFMGSVIGTIVVSLFLPIIELTTRGGGG